MNTELQKLHANIKSLLEKNGLVRQPAHGLLWTEGPEAEPLPEDEAKLFDYARWVILTAGEVCEKYEHRRKTMRTDKYLDEFDVFELREVMLFLSDVCEDVAELVGHPDLQRCADALYLGASLILADTNPQEPEGTEADRLLVELQAITLRVGRIAHRQRPIVRAKAALRKMPMEFVRPKVPEVK